jgi:hypothetical protein
MGALDWVVMEPHPAFFQKIRFFYEKFDFEACSHPIWTIYRLLES